MKQKTSVTTPQDIKRHWHLIDLKNKVLGRQATQIASLLQGKNKPYYTPHLDCGDYIVIINAKDVAVTGNKLTQKTYFKHSGYPGGVSQTPLNKLLKKDPSKVIRIAVAGMIPKNKLREPRLKRLKIFADSNHTFKDKFKNK